ncbi:hypothetical protein HYH02_009811 [Chlamydomonas schloesseri]|uniref:C3H1-type domain-containing protein n=1 Tax=Chlamydomonas schloesseri TaxID=2026947 RepID=A0A835W8V9_9CHLO|nr:hypothetical protein HYH02_009811 [Chlamydomonas schloesseri]|eukprot:KAG2442019.1 hypothetical protein HYH02_009811 [Chlamydomonas schloesseri]
MENSTPVLATLQGVITFKRPLSKKLIFYDLEVAGEGVSAISDAANGEWAELLVKADGEILDVEQACAIRDAVRLGDRVEVMGCHEGPPAPPAEATGAQTPAPHHPTFVVHAMRVVQRWSELYPGCHFVPRPAPWSRKQQLNQPQAQTGPRPAKAGGPQDKEAQVAAREGRAGAANGTATAVGREGQSDLVAQQAAPEPSSSGREQQPSLCKYWAATGRCPKGAACRFAHPSARGGASGAQQTYAQSRRAERLAAAAAAGFVHEAGDGAKRRRAAVLAEWLVGAFGRDYLNSGTGVVDIAGGRGALTFHLTLHCGVRCTLVEPRRAAALSRQQHRALAAAGVKAADFHLPQLRARFGPELWRRGERHARPAVLTLPPLEELQQLSAWAEEDEEGGEDSEQEEEEGRQDEEPSAAVDEEQLDEAERLLHGCSLVVGLHPDQATDSILDFALECGKPFAIVPCCVFPRLFPHRRLRQPLSAVSATRQGGGANAPQAGRPGGGAGRGAPEAQGIGPGASGASSAAAEPSNASPPPLELRRGANGEQAEEEWAEEEVPVESYTQLIAYLRQRAEDAAGLTSRVHGQRQHLQPQPQAQAQLQRFTEEQEGLGDWPTQGGDRGELVAAGVQDPDAAEAAAVGSTAGTVLWLEEQAERWEHGGSGQRPGAPGTSGPLWNEIVTGTGQAAGVSGERGQGAAAGVRYASVCVTKLPFTGANQVVFALPV